MMPTQATAEQSWYVYILRCSDNTLYTGITTDTARRLQEHNAGSLGARYTRARRPVTLVYAESADSRSAASKREYLIKSLSRNRKEALILGYEKACCQAG